MGELHVKAENLPAYFIGLKKLKRKKKLLETVFPRSGRKRKSLLYSFSVPSWGGLLLSCRGNSLGNYWKRFVQHFEYRKLLWVPNFSDLGRISRNSRLLYQPTPGRMQSPHFGELHD